MADGTGARGRSACSSSTQRELFHSPSSSESILDPEYLPWLIRCVQAAQVQSSQLCFQVAEETLNQHLKQTIEL